MPKELINANLNKKHPGQPWGIRIGGGKDRGRVLVLENVAHNSLAFEGGLRSKDYLIKINGQNVFNLTHNECTELVKRSGESLRIEAERGDHIVPNLNEAFPKKEGDVPKTPEEDKEFIMPHKDKPYWMKSIEDGNGLKNALGFSTVGKPKMQSKQYNSPLEMYSEEALEEIMKEGTLNGKPFDMSNLMNPTGEEFNAGQSDVLAAILASNQ